MEEVGKEVAFFLAVKDLLCLGNFYWMDNLIPAPRSGEIRGLWRGSIAANHRSASLTFPSMLSVCVVQKGDLPSCFSALCKAWRHWVDHSVCGITHTHELPYL